MKIQAVSQPHEGPSDYAVGGLALLAISTAAEVGEAVRREQAHGFFLAIGRRMAALEPLEGVSDAEVLCARINAFWQALGWGEVELSVGSDAIVVQHRHLPAELAPDRDGHWRRMLLSVMEGAYDAWFRVLGSGPALRTTATWKGTTLELRHGR